MSERPTIYLTNAASRRPPFRGPGRVLTIMAAPRPRYGEAGEGRVWPLVPSAADLQDVRSGAMSMDMYRARFEARVRPVLRDGDLAPGRLMLTRGGLNARPGGTWDEPVRDGDTLVCACSRAAAAEGCCHRVWAAEALVAAGWRVVLDGVEVPDGR